MHPLFPITPLPPCHSPHTSPVTTPPQRSTHRTPASGSANDRRRTEISHRNLRSRPPQTGTISTLKTVSCCKRQADSFLELRKVFFKAFYTYLRVRVRAPCVHSGTCVHRCTRISLSSINILYVRAVNTPWSCVYVFFKVSYPQCYVNNSIY